MKKHIYVLIISVSFAILLLFNSTANADQKTFVKEYIYQASEVDSKVSCRVIALEQIKRLLLEELGTYLEGITEVQNFQLTKEKITVLTAGIVQTQILNEKWDGERYWVQAKIEADPNEVAKAVDLLRKDRERSKELDAANRNAEKALMEIEKLKRELELARNDHRKIAQYNEAIKRLSAADWNSRGLSLAIAKKYNEAVDAFSKSLQLNPIDAWVYASRGVTYGNLGNYPQAMKDCNKGIELDSKSALSYTCRGFVYASLRNYQKAIEDYSNAIHLDPQNISAPLNRIAAYLDLGSYRQAIEDCDRLIMENTNYSLVYIMRGLAYTNLGNYPQAIADYGKAIELAPQDASAYANRGGIYERLNNHHQAINDCNKAIELNPKIEGAYRIRGLAYASLGNYYRAIEDYGKAIALDPKDATAYAGRGLAYMALGNSKAASINDLKTAARLDHKGAQRLLRETGIDW